MRAADPPTYSSVQIVALFRSEANLGNLAVRVNLSVARRRCARLPLRLAIYDEMPLKRNLSIGIQLEVTNVVQQWTTPPRNRA